MLFRCRTVEFGHLIVDMRPPFHHAMRQGRRGLLRVVGQQQQRGLSWISRSTTGPSHQLAPMCSTLVQKTKLRWVVPSAHGIPAAFYHVHLLSQAASHQKSLLKSFSSAASPDLGGKGGANDHDPGSKPYEIICEHSPGVDQDSPGDATPSAAGRETATESTGTAGSGTQNATPAAGLAAHSEGPPTPPARVPTAMAELDEQQKGERIRELENELEKADLLLLKKDNIIRELEQAIVRVVADAQDLIDRVRREAEATKKTATQCFAKDLTEVADNFDRALASVPDQFRHPDQLEGDPHGYVTVLKTLLDGVEMTKQQLEKVFEKHGLKKFVPLNEPFDPNYHEAVYVITDPSKPEGMILDVVKPGYMLHDRVVRPAQVGVAQPPPPVPARL